jgi:hypothetical protein
VLNFAVNKFNEPGLQVELCHKQVLERK